MAVRAGTAPASARRALLTAGELHWLPYYTMPFVDGESLRARLTREGALPIPEAVRLVREVADALASAHEQRVVHRDLKPENVLLSRGHAMVADFGIAKALATSTPRGSKDEPLAALVARLLAKRPADRPQAPCHSFGPSMHCRFPLAEASPSRAPVRPPDAVVRW